MASSSTAYCDIHVLNIAAEWCSQCEQHLCLECINYHSQAKSSKRHQTIPMEDYAKLPPIVKGLKRTCAEHDEKMDFYCSTHEALCCFYCIQSTHKQCVGTEHLSKVVENIKFSTSMEDLERNIHDVKINVEKIFEDRVQNISNVDKQKIGLLKIIIDTKKTVVQYLDNIEKQIIDELTEIVKRQKSLTDKLLYKLKRKKSKLKRLSAEVTNIKQHASEMDTFLAIKQIGAEINKEEAFLFSLQEDDGLDHTKVSFEKSSEFVESLKNNITAFGRIVVTSEPSIISLQQRKKKQAQIFVSDGPTASNQCTDNMPDNSNEHKQICAKENNTPNQDDVEPNIEDIANNSHEVSTIPSDLSDMKELDFNAQVIFQSYVNIPGRNIQISACKILPNDHFLFLDYNNQCIILYGNGGEIITRTQLTSKPIDFTCITNNEIAVTLYLEKIVCLVDIYKGIELRRLKMVDRCFGIDYKNGKLYVSLPRHNMIQTLDCSCGYKKVRIFHTFSSVFYLTCFEEKLFCSNHRENILFCLSTSGTKLWEFRDDYLLEPLCLVTDSTGNIYVSCRKSNCIMLISTDGTKGRALLRSVAGVTHPRALDICSTSNGFMMCDERSGSSLRYKLN